VRAALRPLAGQTPEHVGLAYDSWAPIGPGGKVPDDQRRTWLARLEAIALPAGYQAAYESWVTAFEADPTARVVEVELASRLLIGHGNPSPTEVGLTVHRTWGVPVIPGSALKGLLAHWVEATFGPTRLAGDPRNPEHPEADRARYQGPTYGQRGIEHGPGDVYRLLFGAPPAKSDPERRSDDPPGRSEGGTGEVAGSVLFHDALYVPGGSGDRPFARDVLTVHQKGYYDRQGRDGWPNDYEGPVPVAFLTVRPGARFLVALSGATRADGPWVDFALPLLRDALREWGVGGKTAAGYGRIRPDDAGWRPVDLAAIAARRAEAVRAAAAELAQRAQVEAAKAAQRQASADTTVVELTAWLEGPGKRLKHGERLEALVRDWKARLDTLTPEVRAVAGTKVLAGFPKQKKDEVRAALGL
jgi:CRISPR-associated protein Cmr6